MAVQISRELVQHVRSLSFMYKNKCALAPCFSCSLGLVSGYGLYHSVSWDHSLGGDYSRLIRCYTNNSAQHHHQQPQLPSPLLQLKSRNIDNSRSFTNESEAYRNRRSVFVFVFSPFWIFIKDSLGAAKHQQHDSVVQVSH